MARSSDSFFLLGVFRDKTFQMRQIRRVVFLSALFVIQSTIVLGFLYHYMLGEIVAGTAPMLFASDEMARLNEQIPGCLLYTSPSPRDQRGSRMPSSA